MFFPSLDNFTRIIGNLRDDGRLADNDAQDGACYALLWWVGTGREFSCLTRALGHMDATTAKAFAKRVEREMLRNAGKRGSDHLIVGDIDNPTIARALGFASCEDAFTACIAHPYGKPFRLGNKGVQKKNGAVSICG